MKTKQEIIEDYKLKDRHINLFEKHYYPNLEDLIENSMNEMRNEILKIMDNLEELPDTYEEFEYLKEDIKNIKII